MRIVRSVAAAALAVVLLAPTGCGAEEPVSKREGFTRADDGDLPGETHRVFESYRQSSRTSTTTVRLPTGTREVRVRMDCVAPRGEIKVSVLDGEVGSPCGDVSEPGGYIALTEPRPLDRATPTKVVVRAPREAVWSVAVDAGSGGDD